MIDLPQSKADKLLRLLYVDVYSALETFLCDTFLSCIFWDDEMYLKAKRFIKNSEKGKNLDLNIEVLEKDDESCNYIDCRVVHNFFTNEIVYHNFNRVEKMFKEIVGVDLPDYESLKDKIHKRNNIVHRFSYSNFVRMQISPISIDDIHSLIEDVRLFAKNLMKNIGLREVVYQS